MTFECSLQNKASKTWLCKTFVNYRLIRLLGVRSSATDFCLLCHKGPNLTITDFILLIENPKASNKQRNCAREALFTSLASGGFFWKDFLGINVLQKVANICFVFCKQSLLDNVKKIISERLFFKVGQEGLLPREALVCLWSIAIVLLNGSHWKTRKISSLNDLWMKL